MRLVRVAVNAEQLLYRSPGGVGRYTAQLLTLLPDASAGDEVVPFTARHHPAAVAAALAGAGVPPTTAGRSVVLPLPRPLLYEGWLGPGYPHLPRLGDADLVHAPSLAVPPHPRVPLVVTVHDAAAELFPESFPPLGLRFHRRGLRAAARRADLVLTVSEAAADEIVDHSTIGRDRIRVVPNGIAPARVDPAVRDRHLARLGLANRPFVLWIGSLEPRKGVGTLVAAMVRLRSRGRMASGASDPVPLVLAGYAGWLSDEVVSRAELAALGADLHQLGPVGEEELWSLYSGAALFAFPSRHEGFGLPVVEAMSQGTPVVASDIPAIREVAGDAARLVPVGDVARWADALEELLADDAARDRMAIAGLARAGRYAIADTISGIRTAYLEAVGR
jgi:glycosyltransferase involved in cell wall biosynthesis